jgi:hypothetical protein
MPEDINVDPIVTGIIKAFKGLALRDIKIIGEQDTLMASFILCSCFIDQLSGFRYNSTSVSSRYADFVNEYLPKYDGEKLYKDLRCKLVHNYSLGDSYVLIRNRKDLHLTPLGVSQFINIENFIEELESAFALYESDLNTKEDIRSKAVEFFEDIKIVGSSIHDLFSFEEAENVVTINTYRIGGLSEYNGWKAYLQCLLIIPSGVSNNEEIKKILKCYYENNCNNKEALIKLKLFEGNKFEVCVVGTDKKEMNASTVVSFYKINDYISLCSTTL